MSVQEDVDRLVSITAHLSVDDALSKYTAIRAAMEASLLGHEDALRATPDDRTSRYALAQLLFESYRLFGEVNHLDQSVSLYMELFSPAVVTVAPPEMLENLLDGLGEALQARYERFTVFDDLQNAIDLHERSLELRTISGLDRAPSVYGLGVALYTRSILPEYRCEDDRRHAVELLRSASEDDNFKRIKSLCYLSLTSAGIGHSTKDYAPSIASALEAVQETPLPHPDHILAVVTAASALDFSIFRLDTRPLREYAVRLGGCVGHPYTVLAQRSLCRLSIIAWESSGPDVIIEAVDMIRALHQRFPSADVLYRDLTRTLTWAITSAYNVIGTPVYLDELITLSRQTVYEQRATNHIPARGLIMPLAEGLQERYTTTGRIADLDEAISLLDLCVTTSFSNLGDLRSGMTLATCLRMRYIQRGRSKDLERAMEIQSHVLPLLETRSVHDSDSVEWVYDLVCLYELNTHHPSTRLATDRLEETICCIRVILDTLDPSARSSEARGLDALATCLRIRADESNTIEDIKEAISLRHRALPVMFNTTGHILFQANLAVDYATLWRMSGDMNDLHDAIHWYLKLINNPVASPQVRLRYAIEWCHATVGSSNTSKITLDAFGQALSLLPKAILFGGDVRTRLEVLRRTPELSVDAAMQAVRLLDASRALQLLEQGRSVFWSCVLRTNLSMQGLPIAIRERLVEVSRELEVDGTKTDILVAHRQSLSREFDSLVETARKIPDYEHFLGSLPLERLYAAAARGPIVVLMSDTLSAVAIIIREATPRIISGRLPGMNRASIQKMATRLQTDVGLARDESVDADNTSRRVFLKPRRNKSSVWEDLLRDLWNLIVKPVISMLGLQRKPTSEFADRPRVFWCPTGPFAFLPLHAAGIYSGDATSLSDYIIFSYVPTITTLLSARTSPTLPIGTHTARILVAATTEAPGYGTLVNATSEAEKIRAVVPETTILEGASLDEFLKELPNATFLHLACHGKQDAQDALNSGFIFRDGIASLSTLLDVKVQNPCFAFLSACESAMGDTQLPDENIHLAAAMLFIGYRSVVGTLWSMNDADGPKVAEKVYSELMKNRETFDYDAVPRALDAAVRELRKDGVHPSRWATWIHMGI